MAEGNLLPWTSHRRQTQQYHTDIVVLCMHANQSAIAAMQQGSDRAAVEILQQALDQLINLRFDENNSENEQSVHSGHLQHETIVAASTSPGNDQEEAKAPSDSQAIAGHANDNIIDTYPVLIANVPRPEALLPVSLYNRAFDFRIDMSVNRQLYVSIQQIHAVTLFNLAFANHRWGLEAGLSAVTLNALSFYQEACCWIEPEAGLWRQSQGMINILAATLYNMALIYGEFGQVDQARILRQHLWHLVVEVNQSNADNLGSDEHFENMGFFYVNLMLAALDDFRLPPAA